MDKNIAITKQLDFLSGGGEMGERIRNFNWTTTPLGDPETWDQSLKTCVRIILTSAQPMFVWWGPSFINIYNDSYAAIMGKKHPAGLGARASTVWAEIWDSLIPKIRSVEQNEGTYDESFFFIMERKGYQEEVYVSFSYSPAPGDDGTVKGIFGICSENTERVINERRSQTLRDVGTVVFNEISLDEIYRNVAGALGKNNKDFPFAIIYKIENNGSSAIATASTGTENKQYVLPAGINLDEPATVTADFCETYRENKLIVTGIKRTAEELPLGAWKKAALQFVYIPISATGNNHPYAVIFAALNPYRQFDDAFHQFCELIGERVSLEINKMLAWEEERKRAEALEQIDKAKTVFFSNISHEFRTPLTLILSPLEELLDKQGDCLTTVEKQSIETVHRNALRLLKLVNTVLDFSHIESGRRQQAGYTATDIATYTKDLVANFRSVMEKAGLVQQQIAAPVDGELTSSAMYVEEAGTLLVMNNTQNAQVTPHKKHLPLVLVVDDNADMRVHIQTILLPYFNVVTANNGQEALQRILEQPPALVLSDVMMPVMDGITLAKEIKANKTIGHIPVILLTARAGEESKIVGWETGADDFLTKPFSSRELISRVTSQIKTQQIRAEALMGIAEQEQHAKKLEDMNRELTKMNEELTSFAYVSSHDLQEPLRKIQMFSKRIMEKEIKVLSEEGRDFLHRMDNAASRMQLLINDLLTYSRTNTSQKHFEKIDLNELIAEVKQELNEKIAATRTRIECGKLPELYIIPFQFKQLFTNLIANSIKFARPEVVPHITISCKAVTGRQIDHPLADTARRYWHLFIADNGTGFDPRFNEQIFGLFQRLHGRSEYEGTGIGLAIAKKVVENHNGIITAEGVENDGATINIYLPVER